MTKKIIFIVVALIVIGGIWGLVIWLKAPRPVSKVGGETQYLLFQMFTGANDGTGVYQQQGNLQSAMGQYIDRIQTRLQTKQLSLAADRRYGFSIGPLALDQSDQELRDTIESAFDMAIEKQVAVGFHFDVTHFWKNAGLPAANQEWGDWSGTLAARDHWDNENSLLPSMCFECEDVKALVDRIAGKVIAPAITVGMERLRAIAQEDLFAGVIIGWEAGSNNPLGYHSLALKGYGPASSLLELNRAQQQILHDYLERWGKRLVDNQVPRKKLYTHTTNFSQWDVDTQFVEAKNHLGSRYADWLLKILGNGPNSFWVAFNAYSNAGFSIYANSRDEGVFEAIYAEAAKHDGSWAEAEGTNTKIDGSPSEVAWETYLGRIFNHGGILANIFGGFGGGGGGYQASTESDEAVAAYRKFLEGKRLKE